MTTFLQFAGTNPVAAGIMVFIVCGMIFGVVAAISDAIVNVTMAKERAKLQDRHDKVHGPRS